MGGDLFKQLIQVVAELGETRAKLKVGFIIIIIRSSNRSLHENLPLSEYRNQLNQT
jgi:hypothetical protein